MTPAEYNLMTKAHRVAKELQEDEFNLHYHIALSRALKIVWNTLNRINKAKTDFTKEEKNIILSVLKPLNKFAGVITLKYDNNAELIKKMMPYSYKNNYSWIDEKQHHFYLSTEIVNSLKN